MMAFFALAVFSGLSMNLLLQFGLGLRRIVDPAVAEPKDSPPEKEWGGFSSPQWAVLFASSLILWLFFTYVLSLPAFGFLESFLLFPATMAVSTVLELVCAYFFPGGKFTLENSREARQAIWGDFSLWDLIKRAGLNNAGIASSSYNGLALASLLLTLRLALSFAGALALTLGFSLGALLAALILREISKRSALEAVPALLRGAPLTLISMGLLSLIFSAVSAILLRVLGVF
jgi:electron transport complex protein RnfA